ncbi:APC family permease [Rhizohabitans arisaemae]|uniref:APC family permease n=1 Tax=Rhizohabitans arisaemae TaxID=2720610 RepID=UPI0024B20348|nr:APC family permease [Rhizohabitans arisaemae]
MAPRTNGTDRISATLAANRLGVGAVVYFVLSAAAPLTVVAGVVTTGYAVTGIIGLPIAFLAVGAVIAVFAVGYVAMARHMANAGAFYSYIAQGLGRPAGVGGAWVALTAYNALQVGLYGAFGAAAAPLLEQWLSLSLEWWLLGLIAWALVAALGLMRVDFNGTILAVLITAEIVVILLFNLADLVNPAAGGVATTATVFSPGALFAPGVGALLVIAVTGFVGFESSVVFSEESRDPRRTVPYATYISIAVIAGLYAFSSWAMTMAVGADRIVEFSQKNATETIFVLAADHLGATIVDIARVLFATSVFAAAVSFHNTTSRYIFALGRERVLPAYFGKTSARTGAPRSGSIAQSVLGFTVIVVFAVLGLDPVVDLFYKAGTLGGFGVLLLITATSLSVLRYFARNPGGENVWRRLIAPGVACVLLGVFSYLAVSNFTTLLGVPPDSALGWVLPGLYLVAAVGGLLWGLSLRGRNPEVYARIGLGAKAAAGDPATGPTPTATAGR